MERHARITLLFASIGFVLILVFTGGLLVAHNAMEHTFPGEAWFRAREIEEEIQITIARDAASRVTVRMNIVAYRLNDLAACIGTSHELDAFTSLDDAVDQALGAIAELPMEQRKAPLNQLSTWMYGAQELLAKTGLARDADFREKFDQKVSAVRDAGERGMIGSDYLRIVATAIPVPLTPVADTSMNSVKPRTVPAPLAFKHSYPLDGAHVTTDCLRCHVNGVYTGTPRNCVACHRDIHTPTLGNQCAACHITKAWTPAKKK